MTETKKTTERDMLDRLNVRYAKCNGNGIRYTRAEHVKVTAGHDSRRICDYMAIDLWTGYGRDAGPKLHGHEVKVSRSDWLTELRDPDKAESFARYCDYWWLVVSDRNIVRPGELPAGWGLMVAYGRTVRVITPATRRENPEPMPRHLQGTLTRAVTKTTLRLDRIGDDTAIEFLANMAGHPDPNGDLGVLARLIPRALADSERLAAEVDPTTQHPGDVQDHARHINAVRSTIAPYIERELLTEKRR